MIQAKAMLRPVLSMTVIALVAAVAIGAGRGKSTDQYRGVYVIPAAQIISFDDTVARLDTATGAIYKYRGDLNNPSVQGTWELRVPAVKGSTSGLLEIQRATFNDPQAIFLVDIVTGDTWLLHERGNSNRSWDEVKIFR